MWTTFLTVLKVNLRNKTALFWMVLFPIVLATLFNGAFGNLEKGYSITPVPMAVVQDANWNKAAAAQVFVDALAGIDTDGTANTDSAANNAPGAASTDGDGTARVQLLTATAVESVDGAKRLLADGTAKGYLTADGNGRIGITLSRDAAFSAGDSVNGSALSITLAALDTVIDRYNRTDAVTRQTLVDNPQALMSQTFWNAVGAGSMTREVTLTNFKPDAMARYYYALLGMACLMAMGYAADAVSSAQANLSALGIRRSVSPLRHASQLLAGFLACWLCSFVALTIALAYIRYVCGVAIGGREPAAVLAVAVASFMASSAGSLLGTIPGQSDSKTGLVSAISCALSLFTGLYGGFAMQLSDWIARHAPVLATVNPAQQVVNLFYSLMYYDGYGPFLRTCGTLLAMSALFLVAGTVILRRQRYEHL